MKEKNPKAECRKGFSQDKSNPTGAAFIAIDFIDDPTDARLGFHGTNTEDVLSTQVTSGCTRTDNSTMLKIFNDKLASAGDFLYYQWRQ